MVAFEKLSLAHLGQGGLAEEPPLIEEVDELLQEAARMVREPGREGPAKITITIAVEPQGNSGITVEHAVRFAEPKRRRKGLAAIVDDHGRVLAQAHKQEALPFGTGGVAVLDEARRGGGDK